MSFSGLILKTNKTLPVRSLNGFYGIKVKLSAVALRITDSRGKVLSNVEVHALNTTTGNSYTGYTNSTGSVFMELDSSTDIILKKDLVTKIVHYNGATNEFQIDLPMIQNN